MDNHDSSTESSSGLDAVQPLSPLSSNADTDSARSEPIHSPPPRHFRLRQLALKELRETLRDRRTIVTLIVMPLLVYPILSLIFRSFLTANLPLFGGGEPVTFQIVYGGDGELDSATQLLTQIGAVAEAEEQKSASHLPPATDDSTDPPATDDSTDPPASGALDQPNPQNSTGPIESQRSVSGMALATGPATQNSTGPIESQRSVSEMALATGPAPQNNFVPFKSHRWIPVRPEDEFSIEQLVTDGAADVGVVFETKNQNRQQIGKVKLISRNDGLSQLAAEYVQTNIELFNDQMLKAMLRRARLPSEPALSIVATPLPPAAGSESETKSGGFSLAALIPLILVLMTITGAVYPAIDLTAGEKERGTLETLMAAPLPRLGILTGKFIAVMTVAVMTALLNMIGMATTVWVFQLDQFLPEAGGFTFTVVVKVFLLLVLFAAFFSALLLAVTSYARSFKEAQAYLIPIIMLSFGPGLLAMTPGLSLSGPWSVTPMVNLLLLARDVIENKAEWIPALVAIVSTLSYGALALMWAANSFGSDAILYQTHGSFGEMFARPNKSAVFVRLSVVMFCLVLLFPLNFVLIGLLGRMPSENPTQVGLRFVLMGVFTTVSFFLFPLLVASHQRTSIRSGFGLNIPRPVFWIIAVLLGISLWPLVMGFIDGWHEVYGWLAGAESRDDWHERLVKETAAQVARVRQVPPWLIAICLSIIPAICEEWFFRGMLLRSLLQSRRAGMAILISAFVFGLFHVLSTSVIAIDRLLPTMLVGLMLGYLAFKSNSILPGIVLHSIHNAAVIFLAYYQPALSRFDWFPGEQDSIPQWWILTGAVVALFAGGLLYWTRSDNHQSASSLQAAD